MADRKYRESVRQEIRGADRLGGTRQVGSGNKWFAKGDTRTPEHLVEYKMTVNKSISLRLDVLEKIRKEALMEGLSPLLGVSIAGQNFYVLGEEDFEEMLDELRAARGTGT